MREKIIEVAKKEIGYVEQKSNLTKYGKWFGFDGVAWCAMFVSWVFYTAGKQLPKIGFSKGYAGCSTMYDYAKKNNLFTDNPQPGDIVLFDFDGNGSWDHTGLFENWTNGTKTIFETIEGNTSDRNASNGGMVLDRARNYNKAKVKFISIEKFIS
jgi:hypothetical protein